MNSAKIHAVGHVIGGVVSGVLVATIGTVAHRAVAGDLDLPYGIVLALLATLLGAVCMRAWSGYVPLVSYGIALAGTVVYFSLGGPGGDVLIANDGVGLAWIVGGMLAVAVAFFLPSSWFAEVPRSTDVLRDGQPSPYGTSGVESGHE